MRKPHRGLSFSLFNLSAIRMFKSDNEWTFSLNMTNNSFIVAILFILVEKINKFDKIIL